jgi:hypothetical protein
MHRSLSAEGVGWGADMVSQAILPAIRETIRENEIGDQSPYVLSFARKGTSGASFGFMQGDTNVSALARSTLRQVFGTSGVDPDAVDRILNAVSRPLPNGNPLSISDTAIANAALGSASGRVLVDAMDEQLFSSVVAGVDRCLQAGTQRNLTITPVAILYIAPWINMTGPPTMLVAWLEGSPELGLPPPDTQLDEQDIVAYLKASKYFKANPQNFAHLQACVAKGVALLPSPGSAVVS